MSNGRPSYEAAQVENERQDAWARRDAFATELPPEGARAIYIKPSSPFTSGNLHMGHVRDYSIGDAYARFRRARGDAVLFGFGFDAFGLPAEMAAIERKTRPAEWVERCGERMLGQMKRLGFSFDYERAFYSSDESQYRWSQWLFLTLHEAGLVYRDGFQYAYASFYAITIPFTGLIFLKRQWIIGKRFGFVTPGEMLSYYFRSDIIRILVIIVALVVGAALIARARRTLAAIVAGPPSASRAPAPLRRRPCWPPATRGRSPGRPSPPPPWSSPSRRSRRWGRSPCGPAGRCRE